MNGIDFIKLQEECATYLKESRHSGGANSYIGSEELAKYYIQQLNPSAIPQEDRNDYSTTQLPKELGTPEARALLNKAVEAGYLNTDYSRNTNKLSAAQTALLAEIISEQLKIEKKWKPFEQLWNMKNLAQTRGSSRDKVGKVRGGENIEQLYK